MTVGELRAWLAGHLEALAGRELPATQIDLIMRRFADVYRGGGAVAPEESPAPVKVAEPTPTQQKYPPRKPKKALAPLENQTPVADKPPYNPEDPQVVRLG